MKYLWHGTNYTDHKLIINGDEGFDMTYSEHGMWGRGIYFAVNASYSHNYRRRHGDGTSGMFFSKVNIGTTLEVKYDKDVTRKFTHPP